jgi:hypothetical protein
MLVALGVSLVVVLATTTALARQQRAYAALDALTTERAELRAGTEILAAELRAIAPGADSIPFAADTAIEFHAVLGASTVCASPAPNRITLPPDTLASGVVLSSWLVTPDTGDVLLVYHDSTGSAPSRGWTRHRILAFSSVVTSGACPPASALTSFADVATGARAYDVTLATPVATSRGAPVRILRRGRYSVYRASDGNWYLGYRRCGAMCAGIQPVSGPYRGTSRVPLTMRFFDRGGTERAPGTQLTGIARIDLVLRAGSALAVAMPGGGRRLLRDSALVSVAMRNAP